jgi:hypothetical protein
MAYKDILLWVNAGLTLALIVRLIHLNLQGVFRLLVFILSADLVTLCLTFAMKREGFWVRYRPDYRIVYSVYSGLELAITACIIFALLRSMMSRHTGILKLSRQILAGTVLLAVAIGLVLVAVQTKLDKPTEDKARTEDAAKAGDAERSESVTREANTPSNAKASQLFNLVFEMLTVDQTVSLVLLLTLVSMLCFLLWFPIDVPRNIAVFSAGYIIFFTVKSLTLFLRYFSPDALPYINISILSISALCYLYWMVFLTPVGETVPVRIGHRWKPQEQERLLDQLGAINATLLRSARRS